MACKRTTLTFYAGKYVKNSAWNVPLFTVCPSHYYTVKCKKIETSRANTGFATYSRVQQNTAWYSIIQHNTANYSTTQHNTDVPVHYVIEEIFIYLRTPGTVYIHRNSPSWRSPTTDIRMMILMTTMTTMTTNLKATPKNIPVSLILGRFLAFTLWKCFWK